MKKKNKKQQNTPLFGSRIRVQSGFESKLMRSGQNVWWDLGLGREKKGRVWRCMWHLMPAFDFFPKQPRFCICAKAPCSLRAKMWSEKALWTLSQPLHFWTSPLDTFHSALNSCGSCSQSLLQGCRGELKGLRKRSSRICCLVFCKLLGLASIKEYENQQSNYLWSVCTQLPVFTCSFQAASSNPSFPQLKKSWKTSFNHSKNYNSVNITSLQTWVTARGDTRRDTRPNQFCHDRAHVSSAYSTVHQPAPLWKSTPGRSCVAETAGLPSLSLCHCGQDFLLPQAIGQILISTSFRIFIRTGCS